MFLRLLICFCLATFTLGYVNFATVETVDGKCVFRGNLIKGGSQAYDEERCEGLNCDIVNTHSGENGEITITGCPVLIGISDNGEECNYSKTKGIYPHCCFGELTC